MFRGKRAQSTLEYALIIAAVIGALLAINAYMKRGVQGRLRESSDQIGKQFDASNFTSTRTTVGGGTTVTTETRDTSTGSTTSQVSQGETVTRSENETWNTEAK